MNYDVVIVGAGTAGLYFGLRLREKGFGTLVLEKEKKITDLDKMPEGRKGAIS